MSQRRLQICLTVSGLVLALFCLASVSSNVHASVDALTFQATWEDGYAADYHKGGKPDPLNRAGTRETIGATTVLRLTGEPITFDNSDYTIANPESGSVILWFIPQRPMSGAPQDVYTLVDLLTLTPENRTKGGLHVWWGWGGFQFKAHANAAELASIWHASLWQAGSVHTLALTWDATNGVMRIYADGEPVSSGTFPHIPEVAQEISFGARHLGTQPFENLVLDEVRIYSRSLDASEIRAIVN